MVIITIDFVIKIIDFIIVIIDKVDWLIINITKDFIAKIIRLVIFNINITFVIENIITIANIHYYSDMGVQSFIIISN